MPPQIDFSFLEFQRLRVCVAPQDQKLLVVSFRLCEVSETVGLLRLDFKIDGILAQAVKAAGDANLNLASG
jgi:hypothetical protein